MARDFTKNTSNRMSLGIGTVGALLNGLGAVSVHAWVHGDTYNTGANDNRILTVPLNGTTAGLILEIDGSAGSKVRLVGRSVSTDTAVTKTGTTDIGTAAFASVGGVWNFAGDSMTPYCNGVAEGGGAAVFANAALTLGTPTGHDMIGADNSPPSGTAAQFDGRIAEVAIWNVDIGAPNFVLLASGQGANLVAAANLIAYLRILGTTSPEPDEVGDLEGTITGTIAQATHPEIETEAEVLGVQFNQINGQWQSGGTFLEPDPLTGVWKAVDTNALELNGVNGKWVTEGTAAPTLNPDTGQWS